MKSSRTRRLLTTAAFLVACCAMIAGAVLYVSPPVSTSTATPRVYDMPPELTRQVAGAVGTTVLGWRVENSDASAGTMRLLAPARFGLAHDEVTATILPSGKNAAVRLDSHALYRGLDFGANARHIRDLQAAMDKQLPLAR